MKKSKKATKDGAAAAMLKPHILDEQYASLGCSMSPLSPSSNAYKSIALAVKNTAEPTVGKGQLCGFRAGNKAVPEVLEIFELNRGDETLRFEEHSADTNRRLLWHGTDIATAAAISSSGLRVMPSAGGRVGAGIYMATECGKSGYYVQPAADGTGVMFLGEVALGQEFHTSQDGRHVSSLRAAPPGFESVVALGRNTPDPTQDTMINCDGRAVRFCTGVPQPSSPHSHVSSFFQDEYLVYKESQVKVRFICMHYALPLFFWSFFVRCLLPNMRVLFVTAAFPY